MICKCTVNLYYGGKLTKSFRDLDHGGLFHDIKTVDTFTMYFNFQMRKMNVKDWWTYSFEFIYSYHKNKSAFENGAKPLYVSKPMRFGLIRV